MLPPYKNAHVYFCSAVMGDRSKVALAWTVATHHWVPSVILPLSCIVDRKPQAKKEEETSTVVVVVTVTEGAWYSYRSARDIFICLLLQNWK